MLHVAWCIDDKLFLVIGAFSFIIYVRKTLLETNHEGLSITLHYHISSEQLFFAVLASVTNEKLKKLTYQKKKKEEEEKEEEKERKKEKLKKLTKSILIYFNQTDKQKTMPRFTFKKQFTFSLRFSYHSQ